MQLDGVVQWAPILPKVQNASPQISSGAALKQNSGLGDEYGRMINEQAMQLVKVRKMELQERETPFLESSLAAIKRKQNEQAVEERKQRRQERSK